MFNNAGSLSNCGPSCPANDPAEAQSGLIAIVQRRSSTNDPGAAHNPTLANGTWVPGPAKFVTTGGDTLFAPYGGYIGERVVSYVAINQTLFEEQIRTHIGDEDGDEEQFAYMHPNLQEQSDWIATIVP